MSIRLARSVTNVTIATFISRIGGYIRDVVVASFFGHGAIADAFYLAFRIPNLLRDLLGEGAVSSAFIPIFAGTLEKEGKDKAVAFVSALLGVLFIVLGVVTLLGVLFAPYLVRMLAWGWWDNSEKLALAINLTRIMFPFIAWISLAALAMSILNSLHIFFIPALAPLLVSLCEVLAVFFLVPKMSVPVEGLAWGVLIGGLFQFLWQFPALLQSGYMRTVTLKLTAEIKKVGLLIVPVAIGSGVRQINIVVDQVCATFLEKGSVTALYYANRLYQLPLALFGLSVVTVALPAMSAAAAKNDINELKKSFSQSMRLVVFALVPASIGLMVMGKPIISMLFEHGVFGKEGTQLTNLALVFYASGLVFFAGLRVTAAVFYALQDTRTPMKIGIMAMIANTCMNVIFMQFLQVGGLALATSLSAAFNMVLLAHFLRKRIGPLGINKLLFYFFKIAGAAGLMGLACFWGVSALAPSWLNTVFVLSGGIVIYLLLSAALQIEEFRYIIMKVKEKNGWCSRSGNAPGKNKKSP